MPQVHNPSRLMDMDSSAFSKNSRYMSTINFTEGSLRRMNALNFLEKRITNIKVKYYNRQERIQTRKLERTRNRMLENMQKRLAYKLVLKTHSISKAKDYHAALQGNYSFESMQHEVKNMMYLMRPDLIREKRARVLINDQQRRYDDVIQKNRENLDRIFPPPKKLDPVELSKKGDGEKSETASVATPLPNIERRNRMSIQTLRRRIITLDDPKPETKSPSLSAKQPLSPIKSPYLTKQPSSQSINSPRRQAMTMSMMKKQKSFLETKEKTNVSQNKTTDNNEKSVDNIIEEKKVDAAIVEVLEKENDSQNGNKSETQKYNILPPIKKTQDTNDELDPNKASTKTQEKIAKLPVLKMKKNVS